MTHKPKWKHFVSKSCAGEKCRMCGAPATHKVAEEIPHDDPMPARHGLTQHVCCGCFRRLMGSAVSCPKPARAGKSRTLVVPCWTDADELYWNLVRFSGNGQWRSTNRKRYSSQDEARKAAVQMNRRNRKLGV